MHILLLGAGGFIGRRILSELIAHGHDVTAIVRREGDLGAAFSGARILAVNLADATDPALWIERLKDIDIIVNAAGVLRGREMQDVHVVMPQALYDAAKQVGVRHAILISAISARADVNTDYAQTKLSGEEILRRSGLPWTIFRPSLVYGSGSYGGTSLLRGMAALPFAVPVPGNGDFLFSPIHAVDLARSIRQIAEDAPAFASRTLEPVGPETLDVRGLLARYRSWLGFGPPRFLRVPIPVMRMLGHAGDAFGSGPVSTNSLVQMMAGNAGDVANFSDAIGWMPRSLNQALREHPAEVQDRWHARLFFLAPAIKAALILLWVTSALLGLFYGRPSTEALIASSDLPASLITPLQIGSSLLDLLVALVVLLDGRARFSTGIQLIVVLGYSIVIGVLLPHLWLDPLGALIKNIPILLLILVHGAIGDRR